MDPLTEAVERVEMGWDRDEARATLADSIQTIAVASRMAKKAISALETAEEEVSESISDLKSMVKELQGDGIKRGRASNGITRAQASKIISLSDKIAKTFDIGPIIRMSLDLTNQSASFVNMMEKIDRKYGEEDKRAAEDITRYLDEEQLMQVYEWVRENKQALS